MAPLCVHPQNPRYFADHTGKAILLTGSHTWGNMQDQLGPDPSRRFDYDAYLEWMECQHFNFMRGWAWEQTTWDTFTVERIPYAPLPYQRTGPGEALDGLPKFDLTALNDEYFERLRSRVTAAGERGIYVSVMLFQGWSIDQRSERGLNPWDGHPFNARNNINGLDGDPQGSGGGRAIHTLSIAEVTRLQDAYVYKLVDTLNDLDNLLYEIGNEHYEESWAWQYHMVDLLHEYERTKAKQHPVGMTSGGGGPDAITNAQLFDSPADWISPRREPDQPYRDDPPAADGSKVILSDTDHLWGLGGNRAWVWKSVTRGLNPLLMDPYEPIYGLESFDVWGPLNRRDHPIWQPLRDNMGHARRYTERMNLAAATPHEGLASTRYCLADPGNEYLVYLPEGGQVTLDLSAQQGTFAVEWFDPEAGHTLAGEETSGGDVRMLVVPTAHDAVLYLCRAG